MVDSIGPTKVKSITKSKPVVGGKTEQSQREKNHSKKGSPSRDGEKGRVGGNIDERC